MLKLSKAGKMPDKCKSWSLQAISTCPGSLNPDGSLVDACAGCYAAKGMYRFPVVKAVREHNRADWQRDDWVSEMISAIKNDKYFRWFDSGDCYALPLARKILAVMQGTPDTMHWLPTRMYKFPKFYFVFEAMNALPNVVVRFSSDSIIGDTVDGDYTSTIVQNPDNYPDLSVCHATRKGSNGKCGDCRNCWDKGTKTIAYIWH